MARKRRRVYARIGEFGEPGRRRKRRTRRVGELGVIQPGKCKMLKNGAVMCKSKRTGKTRIMTKAAARNFRG